MYNPLNLRIISDEACNRVGFVFAMPPSPRSVLIDDITRCVYKRFVDDGEAVIAVFPYESFNYVTGS